VRLLSADHASVELSVARYQFPGIQGQGDSGWDANWLQVAGAVAMADGKSWSFEDPCMTTWEAAQLGSWLNAVADGLVPPSPLCTGQDEHMLVFVEPVVAFSLQERLGDRVQVRVHLSLEALPQWLRGDEQPDIFSFYIVLDMSAAELASAAADWTGNLRRFPRR
jgi:hypothetical protein